jgi:two-component system sensor histidine kinase DctS
VSSGAVARQLGRGYASVRQWPIRARDWLSSRTDVRRGLWSLLMVLVVAVLAILVWLASVYEKAQVQSQVERNAVLAARDIRQGLNRNLQSLQALHSTPMDERGWLLQAAALLHERRELTQIRWLDAGFGSRAQADSPYQPESPATPERQLQMRLTCALAAQNGRAQYSSSYFQLGEQGLGQERIDVCQAVRQDGVVMAYQLASYSLKALLAELLAPSLLREHEVSFVDLDGARLALISSELRRSSRGFGAQQIIELPGISLSLKLVYWHSAPSLFPNLLTGLVTLLTIALITVLSLLAKDMARRQRAEQEVAAALALRNAMENSLITGLRARDLSGRIFYVNPAFCEMVGLRAEQLLGSGMPAPYWPPENVEIYHQRRLQLLHGALAPAPRMGQESVFMRPDGTRFPVQIYEAPLLDADGQQTGWMSAVIDISEQRRIEELSRASQERLQASARLATVGEMASLISHEINQPLAAISSYASGCLNLLREAAPPGGVEPPARQQALQRAVQNIAQQAERVGKVITSVRDFVQRRHHAYEAFPPQQLQTVLDPLLTLQARKLGVRLEWQLEPDLPPLYGDRTMIEQVVFNLARNGMQAMEHSRLDARRLSIQIECVAAPERARMLRISVADLGTGIAPEMAEHLFSHFFSTKSDGMGLGLSLCRTVVEQHGGQLSFEANLPCGTIFRFTLPLQPVLAAAPEALPAAGNSQRSLSIP